MSLCVFLYIHLITIECVQYFVDPRRTDFDISLDDGKSWNTAFTSITQALTVAETCKRNCVNLLVFLLGNYTYTPITIDRDQCFQTPANLKIYGGCKGTETSPSDRPTNEAEMLRYETILSGDIGNKGNNSDNCYHVITYSKALTLDRVTIVDGNANFQTANGYATQDNALHRYGGAIISSNPFAVSETLHLHQVSIINNTAINGGALWFQSSPIATVEVTITKCIFRNNVAINGEYEGGYGGAIYLFFLPRVTITDSQFIHNTAEFRGGAIYQDYGAILHIEWSIFDSNIAINGHGGAIFSEDRNSQTVSGTRPTIYSCDFQNNSASENGGAICFFNDVKGTLEDNRFEGNTANYGGAIAVIDSEYTGNNHFSNNLAINDNTSNNNYSRASYVYTQTDFIFEIDHYKSVWNEMENVYFDNMADMDINPYKPSTAVCRVNPTSTDDSNADGSSWGRAMNNIQNCLSTLKENGGEVWVMGNYTYHPSIIPQWKIDLGQNSLQHRSFVLYDNVLLYGGFSGEETHRTERNVFQNPTYLSCNLSENHLDTYCHQILQGANTIIDGFIFVQSGYAPLFSQNRRRLKNSISEAQVLSATNFFVGAGLYSKATSITIVNSIFYKLFSAEKGGAVYCIGKQETDDTGSKSPTFLNVAFVGNRALIRGGAISGDSRCDFQCKYCIFDQNECAKKGGAIYLDFDSNPKIQNSLFTNNTALESGGCIAEDGESLTILENTMFRENAALWAGDCLYAGSGVSKDSEQGFEIAAINISMSDVFGGEDTTDQRIIYLWPFATLRLITNSGIPTLSPTPEPTAPPTLNVPNFVIFIVDDLWYTHSLNKTFHGPTVTRPEDKSGYSDIPTPYIDAFLNSSVIFQRSYSYPKCAPSRFSLLTGRSPVYSEWSMRKAERVSEFRGAEGVKVTVSTSKISGDDATYNIPAILKKEGYKTGFVGKYHLMSLEDEQGSDYDCQELDSKPNALLYEICTNIVKTHGWNFVDGYQHGNLAENEYFSHNPEWWLQQSEIFMRNAKSQNAPFFLYVAPTLTHTPDPLAALVNFTSAQTPKGILTGNDIPDPTIMSTREEILNKVYSSDIKISNTALLNRALGDIWVDDLFGNLIKYLKSIGSFDNTFVVFLNDHGQGAKGLLYEQGSRIMQAVSYPRLFGTDSYVLPPDFITSTSDFASVIFSLAQIDMDKYPYYKTDLKTNWINDVLSHIALAPPLTNYMQSPECCKNRTIDMYWSHARIEKEFKYIFRAIDGYEDTAEANNYPSIDDSEQFYDLEFDESEQVNLLANEGNLTSTLKDLLFEFRLDIWNYVRQTCFATDKSDCFVPNMSYIPSESDWRPPTQPPTNPGYTCDAVVDYEQIWKKQTVFNENRAGITKTEKAEQTYLKQQSRGIVPFCTSAKDFTDIQYVYNFTEQRENKKMFSLQLNMRICCEAGKSLGQGYIVLHGLNGYKGNYAYEEAQLNVGSITGKNDGLTLKSFIVIDVVIMLCCLCSMSLMFVLCFRLKKMEYEQVLHDVTVLLKTNHEKDNQKENETGMAPTSIASSAGNDVESGYVQMTGKGGDQARATKQATE